MNIAYWDCFSGVSGDMILGALVDAGLDGNKLEKLPIQIGLPQIDITIEKVIKLGITATKVHVNFPHEHVHRHLPDIERIIDAAAVSQKVKSDAKAIFLKVAQAEAQVHGIPVKKVHFHEVGALDSIFDIIATAWGVEQLGIEKHYYNRVALGAGRVQMAHGIYPIPAPATSLILKGSRIEHGPVPFELTTPTGAAILMHYCQQETAPSYSPQKVGYGAGTANFEQHPNLFRLILGTVVQASMSERVVLLQANIDDMNPQHFPFLIEQMIEAKALDAYITPIIMKKGRPAFTLNVLAHSMDVSSLEKCIFEHSTTIGIRKQTMQRTVLKRSVGKFTSSLGVVDYKQVIKPNGLVEKRPEFESLKQIALKKELPLRTVEQIILKEINSKEPDAEND